MNIRWANPICDMIIPQRTTMAGWFMLMPTLWLLIEGSKTGKRKYFVILALLASTMPMIHTHSFLSLGVISLGMMIIDLIFKKDKKQTFYNYLIYGLIVILIAFPQLFYWTFSQTIGNESFLKYHFNWVNNVDPYIWFYIKNWGITFIFLIPAFIYADKENISQKTNLFTHSWRKHKGKAPASSFIKKPPRKYNILLTQMNLKFFIVRQMKVCLI